MTDSSYKMINREVLRLAVPSIFASVTVPLVGVVDTAIVGHLADAAAIGGFAIGSMLFGLMYWCFGFLRIGTSGMVAQAYGRKDVQAQANIFYQSVLFALCGATFLLAVHWLFYTGVMALMPCSDAVRAFTHDYFFIRIWAAPATLLLMTFKGFFIGEQNAVASLILDLTVNVVNILASTLLALYTPMGISGVIYGTVIAQYTGLAAGCVILLWRYKLVLFDKGKEC